MAWYTLRCLAALLLFYSIGVMFFLYYILTQSSFSVEFGHAGFHRLRVPTTARGLGHVLTGSVEIQSAADRLLTGSRTAVANRSLNLPRQSDSDFQPLPNDLGYVYSAYYDDVRKPPTVTVVALVNRSAMAVPAATQSLTCLYGHGGEAVPGRVRVFPDHKGKMIRPAFIHCPVPKSVSTSMTVSITTQQNGTTVTHSYSNSLPVQPPRHGQPEFQFLICFSPLHGNFSSVVQVVENLELAQVLGAQHAVVYNTSIAPSVDRVLRHYVRTGFLEVKTWRGPPEPVHYKGQMAAINDCLLDNRHRADFIVYMDFDEMIVPRVHKSWSSMMEAILRNTSPSDYVFHDKNFLKMSNDTLSRISKTALHVSSSRASSNASSFLGAFSFPNAYFIWDKPTNLTRDELQFARRLHVPFLLKQQRVKQMWEARSKTFIKPKVVDIMGIHRVAAFHGQYRSLLVHHDIGLLHHYRWYSKTDSVKDTSILRFASRFVDGMTKTFNKLQKS